MKMKEPEQTIVESSGQINLSPRILELAEMHSGDKLAIVTVAPGIIQLRKIPAALELDAAEVKQRVRQALVNSGYTSREQIVRLLRDIRQEMTKK